MESKILIFGGTGYVGSYMVKASIKLGHPTFVYSRPNSTKTDMLQEFQSMGATLVKGELDEHEKLVQVLREVDVVISTFAGPQAFDQLKIIEAMKIAGNIKRFIPSDFGIEEDRVSALPAFEAFLDKKKKVRRAIEEAKIPYTFVSANMLAAYALNNLLHPYDQGDDIIVFGSGEAKVVLNYEEDAALFTIKAATDPRTCNRIMTIRPQNSIVSQLEWISLWENKVGRKFNKVFVSEEEIVSRSQNLPHPKNTKAGIAHCAFIKGITATFDLGENDVEASTLFPDVQVTSIEEVVDLLLCNPPKPHMTAF